MATADTAKEVLVEAETSAGVLAAAGPVTAKKGLREVPN